MNYTPNDTKIFAIENKINSPYIDSSANINAPGNTVPNNSSRPFFNA